MAVAILRYREHERRLARFNERRSPQAGSSSALLAASTPVFTSAEVSSSTTPETDFTKPPTSVKALAAVLTVIGLILVG